MPAASFPSAIFLPLQNSSLLLQGKDSKWRNPMQTTRTRLPIVRQSVRLATPPER